MRSFGNKSWLPLVAVASITPLLGPLAVIAPASADTGLQGRLDQVVAAGSVGAVAEVRQGARTWRSSSGVARIGTSRPVPVDSRFRAGSITKTFVSTVVLQLAGEGRLHLGDPVERWLPGVVPGGNRITLRMLLDHTSGLDDYRLTLPQPPDPAFLRAVHRTWSPATLVRRAVANPPVFRPPGSAFSYSNTNYLLLGQVIEAVTGRSYAAEVRHRILAPLGLRHTTMPGSDPRIHGPHPHGYVPIRSSTGPVRLVDLSDMNPSVMGAGGELVSTTADLDRFFRALLSGRLLPDRQFRAMRTPGVPGDHYGLGLAWRTTSCGVRVIGNDGDAAAYQAWSYSTRDGRRQVTVALTPDFSGDVDDAVDALLDAAVCG